MKLKFFKTKKIYKRESFKTFPDMYWKILMIFSLIFLIIAFAFAYTLFVKVSKEYAVTSSENREKISKKEKEKIKNSLDYFSDRERKSTEILEFNPLIVDPSL